MTKSSETNVEPLSTEMLCSVLPWEWILENVLDLKEFSLPCLKELIRYIPHIEDSRCSKLLQKVALRYLEEIVLTREVNLSAITLIKYILEAHGGSSLRRIHSLKESVENELILRVETEVVLATIRHKDRNGGRNWEAFEDAVEEVFPESTREMCKAQRRKELVSILSVDEHRDDLCEQVLCKYPPEDLLKNLLLFIESKKKLLKTKFLDQLAKDVHSGSYIPSSPSRPSAERLSVPTCASEEPHGNPEVSENRLPRDKAVLPYSSQTEPSLPKILLGEPIERSTKAIKEPLARVHINRSSPSSSVNLLDGEHTPGLVEEARDRTVAEKGTSCVDKVPVQEDLRLDMREVDQVTRELTSQMNEFVQIVDKFAADTHKVAVSSTQQAYALVDTVVAQEEQRVDSVSFLPNFDGAAKRPATDQLPESAKKSQRGCLDDSPSRGTDIDGGSCAKVGLNVRNDETTGPSMRKDDLNIELDCSVAGDGPNDQDETPLYRRFKAFHRQSTQERFAGRPRASTVSFGPDTSCVLCKRRGVLLSCQGCSVLAHERCLEELDMGKAINEPCWYCPSCVERWTFEVLERVKAEADTARKKAADFVLARSKNSTQHHSSPENASRLDQITVAAVLQLQETTELKNGKKQAPGPKCGLKASSLVVKETPQVGKEASQAQKLKGLERWSSSQTSNLGDGRYCLRPRVLSNTWKGTESIDDKVEDLPRPSTIAGVNGPEAMRNPSSRETTNKSVSKVVTPIIVQSTPQEIFQTGVPPGEGLENNLHTNFTTVNCSNEGKEAVNNGSSGSKRNVPGSEDLNPAEDSPVNVSKAGVDEGDRHDGDLEEDINRHRDGAECSEDEQTRDHQSPVDERTLPRIGRYRGRWKIPGVRRRNLPWSESEVDVLREGVKQYSSSGWGFRWKSILEFGNGVFDPSRTPVDLKDKWRNLNKFNVRSSSSDES